MTGTKEKADIALVKHRNWLIPAGGASYKKLAGLGFPTTRIHTDCQELLSYALKKKGMTAQVKGFSEVMDKFTDEISSFWLTNDSDKRECKITKTSMEFRTSKKSAQIRGLKDADKLKSRLESFLRRWGMNSTVNVSESHSLVKVQCAIAISDKPPVIAVSTVPDEQVRKILQFGFSRFVSWTVKDKFHWRLECQAGSEWVLNKEGNCLVQELRDPTDHLKSLMEASNAE